MDGLAIIIAAACFSWAIAVWAEAWAKVQFARIEAGKCHFLSDQEEGR